MGKVIRNTTPPKDMIGLYSAFSIYKVLEVPGAISLEEVGELLLPVLDRDLELTLIQLEIDSNEPSCELSRN